MSKPTYAVESLIPCCQADPLERSSLPVGHAADREVFHRRLKQAVEVELGAQMQEHRTKTDGGAVHQHELARQRDRTFFAQRVVHLEGLAAAVIAGLHAVADAAHPVL